MGSNTHHLHLSAAKYAFRALWSIAALVFLSVPALAQSPPDAHMAEGNRMFRSGLYYGALRKYRDSQAAGNDSALLYYNLGVTQYKLRHYADAETALRKASEEPKLAALAFYNLGLTSRARGDKPAAERWFQLAAERAGNRKLRNLASRAYQQMREGVVSDVRVPDQELERADLQAFFRRQDPIGELSLVAVARVGNDDNVYRTPSEPYIDLSQPGQPLVTPAVQSGTFMPIDLQAQYTLFGEGDSNFHFKYTLDGDFYFDPALDNANETHQELSFGADVTLNAKEPRSRTIDAEFIFGHHKERNFDPDDGLDREINGVNVSDRFSYQSWGPKAEFKHRFKRLGYGLNMEAQLRAYDDPEVLPNFSHEFYLLGSHLFYRVTRRAFLRFDTDYYMREYDERPARDATGTQLLTNPPLEYTYLAFQTSFGYRLSRKFWARLDYRRTQRDDQFVGYNDYTQNAFRGQLHFRPTARWKAHLSLTQRSFDYPNAFAFNEPAGGPKDLDAMTGSFWSEFRVTKKLSIWVEASLTDVTSTDARTEYDRTRTMLGVKWES